MPVRTRATGLGRFVQRVGLARGEGWPYIRHRFTIIGSHDGTSLETRSYTQYGIWQAAFHRGFPGWLLPSGYGGAADRLGDLIRRWASVAPLDHLGLEKSAAAVRAAVSRVLAEGKVKTPDLGGRHTTTDMGDAVVNALG